MLNHSPLPFVWDDVTASHTAIGSKFKEMAGEGGPSEKVQNYLDKHKISSLFQVSTYVLRLLLCVPVNLTLAQFKDSL